MRIAMRKRAFYSFRRGSSVRLPSTSFGILNSGFWIPTSGASFKTLGRTVGTEPDPPKYGEHGPFSTMEGRPPCRPREFCKRLSGQQPFAWLSLLLLALSTTLQAGVTNGVSATLAATLASENDHDGAALEYRRAALEEVADSARQAAWTWYAARESQLAGRCAAAETLIDRFEELDPGRVADAQLLRAENAAAARRWSEAAFFYRGLAEAPGASPALRRYAARRLAAAELRQGQPAAARGALALSPEPEPVAAEALDRWQNTSRKRPWLGGLLGLIPGAGYAYSGEYANAVRSAILNGLFIWGMVDTADDNHWGLFAVVSFFEVTWYSGSIYGGIDAAQRYNRDHLDEAVRGVQGQAAFKPSPAAFPLLSLQFSF